MATRFILNNFIDLATLGLNSGTSVVNNFSLDNVKLLPKSSIVRFTNSSFASFYGKLNEAKTINSFCICGHNFIEGTTLILRLYDNTTRTFPYVHQEIVVLNSETAHDNTTYMNNLAIWLNPIEGILSFDLTIVSSIPQYYEIYRLFMGNYIQTEVGASLNNIWYLSDTSKQFRTEGGTLRTEKSGLNKHIEFDLSTIREIERSELQYNLALVGKRKEFFISVFSNSCDYQLEKDYSAVVKMSRIPSYSEYAYNIYNSKIVVEEV